jgi:hypothetical protein
MSEISHLSDQYKRIVDLSNRINNAVIILRKKEMNTNKELARKYRNIRVKKESIEQARKEISDFLKDILSVIKTKQFQTGKLPYFLIHGFNELIKKNPYLENDLEDLVHKLDTTGKELTTKDFELLDKILSVIDEDRTNVFRKLRSKKG